MNANIRTIGGAVGAAVMSSIVTSTLLRERVPGRVRLHAGFVFLAIVTAVAVVAAVFIPSDEELAAHGPRRPLCRTPSSPIIAGGTLTEG